jgi:hypothetical protein
MALFLVALPEAAMAQEKRGADLIVTPRDGYAVAGELIAVKQNALVLMSPAGKDESIEIYRISTITIARKSKAGSGFLIGFLVGGVGGAVLGHNLNKGDPDYETTGAVAGFVLFGALAGLIGLGIGAASGGDETIEFAGLSEAEIHKVLDKLRGMARMRTAQ